MSSWVICHRCGKPQVACRCAIIGQAVQLVHDETWMTLVDPPQWLLEELFFMERQFPAKTKGGDGDAEDLEESVEDMDQPVTEAKIVLPFEDVVVRKRPMRKTWLWWPMDSPETAPHIRLVRTFAGLRQSIVHRLEAQGTAYQIHDTSNPFPEPMFDRFRNLLPDQEKLLREALSQNRSGLIGAPTRYGKSYLIYNILRAFPEIPATVIIPGVDLMRQGYEELKEKFRADGREVKRMGGGSRVRYSSKDITVCSADSIHRLEQGRSRLVIVDEPHALPTNGRWPDFVRQFDRARKYGLSASLSGRFDNRDILVEGLIGPKLVMRTFQEAVELGMICPIVVFMIQMPLPSQPYTRSYGVYHRRAMLENEHVVTAARALCDMIIPADWQTLLFIANERQAEFVSARIPNAVVAMAKKLKNSERKALFADMQSAEVKRCMSTTIYEQGVTFPDLRVIINLRGGGPYTSAIQRPGRLAQKRPGKRCGVMIDFAFTPSGGPPNDMDWAYMGQAKKRRAVYEALGYTVVDIETQSDFIREFRERCL